MIRVTYGMRVISRVSTDVCWDRVGVVVKIEGIIQSCCDGMVMSSVKASTPKYVSWN